MCRKKNLHIQFQLTFIPLKVLIAFVSTRAALSESGDLREGESQRFNAQKS